MKITKSLAVAAGLVIGGLNVSAKTMEAEESAQKETTEMKTYVTIITPDQESQILTVEQDFANRMQLAHNTVTDDAIMKTDEKQLWNDRHEKIKAILTADQFRQYRKIEKIEKYNSHHNTRWAQAYYVQLP